MFKFRTVIGKSVLTLLLSIIFILTGFFTFTQLVSYSQDETPSNDIEPDFCKDRTLDPGDGTDDLLIAVPCNVGAGVYKYRNVNIIKGGVLNFLDTGGETNFWAKSILVENGGSLIAGTNSAAGAFGAMEGHSLFTSTVAKTIRPALNVSLHSSPRMLHAECPQKYGIPTRFQFGIRPPVWKKISQTVSLTVFINIVTLIL